jgi:creatinine amidohydrolase/Fe(II)-dependent formamide hydrolase-like protein
MGGGPYNGTTGLDGQTLTSSLRDIIRELVRHGVRRVLVLDGHFENQMFRCVSQTGTRDGCLDACRGLLTVLCPQH